MSTKTGLKTGKNTKRGKIKRGRGTIGLKEAIFSI